MLIDVIEVTPLKENRLKIKFADGKEGVVDIKNLLGSYDGIFQPLNDEAFFRSVTVNPEIGTICWPNDADICADLLYAVVTGQSIESLVG